MLAMFHPSTLAPTPPDTRPTPAVTGPRSMETLTDGTNRTASALIIPLTPPVDVRWACKSSGQPRQHVSSKSGTHALLSDGDEHEQTDDLIVVLQPVAGPSQPAPRPAITPTIVLQQGQQSSQDSRPARQPRRRPPRNPTFNNSDLARKKGREELIDVGLPPVPSASRFAPTTY
ncbi:hypothetical protein FRB99_008923, partial [Tulasnella sp. 403]